MKKGCKPHINFRALYIPSFALWSRTGAPSTSRAFTNPPLEFRNSMHKAPKIWACSQRATLTNAIRRDAPTRRFKRKEFLICAFHAWLMKLQAQIRAQTTLLKEKTAQGVLRIGCTYRIPRIYLQYSVPTSRIEDAYLPPFAFAWQITVLQSVTGILKSW